VRVTAVTGGLTLLVETSVDGSTNWKAVSKIAIAGAGDYSLTFGDVSGYLRARWVVTGGNSATLSVSGESHQIYCTPEDMLRFGLPADSISALVVCDEERIDACLAATDEAEGYLATRYTMPLQSWGDALRLHSSKLAIVALLDGKGWQASGPDDVIMAAYNRAIAWLKGVARGDINPPGVIDSSVPPGGASSGSRARVSSATARGW
jgi:phage gp36-like protein